MTLKVIGAGFGRTGTDSMREALTILGFGPCHHMFEVNAHEEQKQMWRALVKGAPPVWERLFAGYGSCMDWPSVYYWRELIAFYPEAKVVLTHRSPESWWKSFEQTIVRGIEKSFEQESLGIALIRDKVFGGRPGDRDNAIAIYEANVNAVKATVPPERLLVHNLGDGWEPLCAHLGVPVPAQPYPSRNNASDFQNAGPERRTAVSVTRGEGADSSCHGGPASASPSNRGNSSSARPRNSSLKAGLCGTIGSRLT